MGRKQKQYHYIYKTTNLVNGKYYVGMHSTDNLNDGYLGSGYKIRRSVKKYGKENFKLEILEMLPDRRSLKEREKVLVNEDLLKDPMCMNLTIGGTGGFTLEQQRLNAHKSNEKQKLLRENNPEWVKKKSENLCNGLKKSYQNGIRIKKQPLNWNGRKHSEKTKQLLSEIKKGTGINENNSQYGTMWITNGIENKKIKKETDIPQGWYKGRK